MGKDHGSSERQIKGAPLLTFVLNKLMEDARLSRVGVPNHKELEEEICSQSVAHVSTANKSKAKGEATAYMCVCVSVCVCECVRPNVLSTLSWQHQPAEKGKHNQKPYTQEPSLTHRMFRSWLCCCFVALLRVCLLANGKCVFFPFLLPSLSLSLSSALFLSLSLSVQPQPNSNHNSGIAWLADFARLWFVLCVFVFLPFAFCLWGFFVSSAHSEAGSVWWIHCFARMHASCCGQFMFPLQAFCILPCKLYSLVLSIHHLRNASSLFWGFGRKKKKSAKKKAKQKRKRKKSKSVWWHAISRTHNLTLVSILFPLAFGFCCLLLFPPPSDLCVCVCVCVCVSGAPTLSCFLFCFLLPLLASCWMRDSLSN